MRQGVFDSDEAVEIVVDTSGAPKVFMEYQEWTKVCDYSRALNKPAEREYTWERDMEGLALSDEVKSEQTKATYVLWDEFKAKHAQHKVLKRQRKLQTDKESHRDRRAKKVSTSSKEGDDTTTEGERQAQQQSANAQGESENQPRSEEDPPSIAEDPRSWQEDPPRGPEDPSQREREDPRSGWRNPRSGREISRSEREHPRSGRDWKDQ